MIWCLFGTALNFMRPIGTTQHDKLEHSGIVDEQDLPVACTGINLGKLPFLISQMVVYSLTVVGNSQKAAD